jgi:HEAT repeat protein
MVGLLLAVSNGVARAQDGPRRATEVDPEDGRLLAYLERYVEAAEVQKRVDELIQKLGDNDFDTREEASRALIDVGQPALSQLREARKSDDVEVARRAEDCLSKIGKEAKAIGTTAEVVERLLKRQPAGTVEALMRFLPHAEDAIEEAIYFGLNVAVEQQNVDVPALTSFLDDKAPARRALAGLLMARHGNEEQRTKARKLLADAEVIVRLRTAQGLLGAEDKAGIPTLIALLNQRSTTVAWQAEELLCWVAGEDAPKPRVGAGDADKKKKAQQAWQAWWRQEEKRVDLKQVKQAYRRPFLLFVREYRRDNRLSDQWGRICLVGGDDSVRWQLNEEGPINAMQLLRGDRVLTGGGHDGAINRGQTEFERRHSKLIERDLNGENDKLLDETVGTPLACRRLPNGNTLVIGWGQRAELSKEGKVVFHEVLPPTSEKEPNSEKDPTPLAPYLLSNGRLCYENGAILEVEPETGEIVKEVAPVERLGAIQSCEARPTGGYLFVVTNPHRIVEIDSAGKIIRTWPSRAPILQVKRLPNGATLVLTLVDGQSYLVERDRSGRTVWQTWEEDVEGVQDGLSLVRVGLEWPDRDEVDLTTSVSRQIAESNSSNPVRRFHAASDLARIKNQEARVTPVLLQLLRDPDERVRTRAVWGLRQTARVEELPLFLEAAKDPRLEVRIAVLSTFFNFQNAPDNAVPVLLTALQDEAVLVRREAARVLFHFPPHPKVLPALIQALKDPDRPTSPHEISVAEHAVWAIRAQGSKALPAVEDLLGLLDDQRPTLRRTAIEALALLAQEDDALAAKVIPAFIARLKDVHEEVNWPDLAAGVATIGPRAKKAIPTVIQILEKHQSRDLKLGNAIRCNCLYALREMKAEAKAAAPTVAAIVMNSESPSQEFHQAATILIQLGPEARGVRATLEKPLAKPDDNRQRLIDEILKAIKRD